MPKVHLKPVTPTIVNRTVMPSRPPNAGPFTELTPAPVANFITTLHDVFWQALLVAVTLHVLAVLLYWAAKRQNLLLPMITGCKVLPLGVRPPAQAGTLRALLFLGCGCLVAAALANFL